MSLKRHSRQVMWAVLITLLLVGCVAPAAPPTPIPPTATPIPPTPIIVVAADGNGCTVSGPTELPTGEHLIALKVLTTRPQTLYVSHLLDGKTYQDVLDYQGGPGKYKEQPSWLIHQEKKEVGQLADGETVYSFLLNEKGEHAIYTYIASPRSIWHCAPLRISD